MKPQEWNERDFVPRERVRWHEQNCPDQWERYRFAARWLGKGQQVLDIATYARALFMTDE